MTLPLRIRIILPVSTLTGAALALAASALAAPPALRMSAVALGIGLSVGSAAMVRRASQLEGARVRSYIDRVCRRDASAPQGESPAGFQPLLADNNPWTPILRRLEDCLREDVQRWQDLEHARAAAEVRTLRLKEQHQQITEVFDALAQPVVAVNRFGEVTLANASARRLFEISGDPRQPADRVLSCQPLVELLTETRRHKGAGPRSVEFEHSDAQGAARWFRASARVVTPAHEGKAEAGEAMMVVLQDISSEKAVQRRHAEFVSSVSHEMKTPLAGIKAYVELLADGEAEDDATREEFLEVINGQADRLQRLIDNLLNLARIEAGVVEVSKAPRSLNEVLEEAASVIQPAAEKKRISLQRELSPMYIGVLADRDMLLQCAINLLSNAVKYTPAGGRVTLRSRLADRDAIFEVEDTGVGLSPEDSEKVFEKFYRVTKDREMAAGTGLGLPLAKHIVEDVHGGTLTVQSQLGAGSVFHVSLPGQSQIA